MGLLSAPSPTAAMVGSVDPDQEDGGKKLAQSLGDLFVLALQIERYYTKNQIMELYANHIFLGANAYGVEAGAETYFGKQAKDLTLEEAALLAGIPKAPVNTRRPRILRERKSGGI